MRLLIVFVCAALLAVAHYIDSRRALLLLELILKTPALVDRLAAALQPGQDAPVRVQPARRKKAS